MPEVPNLNNNLQRFIGVASPVSNTKPGNNGTVGQNPSALLHREKSKSATLSGQKPAILVTPRSVASEQAQITSLSKHVPQPQPYIQSPLHSPRLAFITTQFLQNQIAANDEPRISGEPSSGKAKSQAQPVHSPGGGKQNFNNYDDDEVYLAMSEYGLYQELGKRNGLYTNKVDDKHDTCAKSLLLPDLAPY
ncbi:hypothetical protein PoB_005805000 [Plakobranchus ocellatus]|uniref:Uncharacterized protein n=1 Tax=Plakobranchus ocellatus TaxID=259542 RepID=A0AAV4CIW9_9GAST|nr:hypothetical protein PoB_005805000 [Plakobranchus ocellatus]